MIILSKDKIEEIESKVAKQLQKEAYEATDSIENGKIQYTTFKLMLDNGLRGMRLFLEEIENATD